MRSSFSAALISTATLIGCSQPPAQQTSNGNVAPLLARLDALEKKIEQLEAGHAVFRTKIDSLRNSAASINTEEETYSVANSTLGPFLIVCKSVTPYLDGYRILLNVGNTTNVTFRGLKISLDWSEAVPPKGDYLAYWKARQKDVDVTQTFHPGTYTAVNVTIGPATAGELKALTVSVEPNQLSLPSRR